MPTLLTPNEPLSCLRIGTEGSPLILVHGIMETAITHLKLAEALLRSRPPYTTHLYSRRGRGCNRSTIPPFYFFSSFSFSFSSSTTTTDHVQRTRRPPDPGPAHQDNRHRRRIHRRVDLSPFRAHPPRHDREARAVRVNVQYQRQPKSNVAGPIRSRTHVTANPRAFTTALVGAQLMPRFFSHALVPWWAVEGLVHWGPKFDERKVEKKRKELERSRRAIGSQGSGGGREGRGEWKMRNLSRKAWCGPQLCAYGPARRRPGPGDGRRGRR